MQFNLRTYQPEKSISNETLSSGTTFLLSHLSFFRENESIIINMKKNKYKYHLNKYQINFFFTVDKFIFLKSALQS